MSFYRFPKHVNVNSIDNRQAHEKIGEELLEAVAAYWMPWYVNDELRQQYGMELLDIIHATETALRKEFSDEEVEQMRAKVIEKNARRGYYGGLK